MTRRSQAAKTSRLAQPFHAETPSGRASRGRPSADIVMPAAFSDAHRIAVGTAIAATGTIGRTAAQTGVSRPSRLAAMVSRIAANGKAGTPIAKAAPCNRWFTSNSPPIAAPTPARTTASSPATPGPMPSTVNVGFDSLSVSTLAARHRMSFAAVQKQVAALERARLVSKLAVGRERIVRGNPERPARARAALVQLESLRLPRFGPLDDVLLAHPPTHGEPMPITSVTSDPRALTLTVVGDDPVSVERLREAHSDPRPLERFRGPTARSRAAGGASCPSNGRAGSRSTTAARRPMAGPTRPCHRCT